MAKYEGTTEKDVTTLRLIYQEAEKEIVRQARVADIANRKSRLAMLAQVRLILNSLGVETQQFLGVALPNEYIDGWVEASDTLGMSFGVIDPRALTALFDFTKSQVSTALGSAFQNIENLSLKLTKQAMDEVIQKTGVALITGKTREKLSKEFAQILQANGVTGYTYTDKNGKVYNVKLETYVDTLARSALRDARNTATVERTKEAGTDLVKVSKHPNPSPLCSPWQGEILSVSGDSQKYKTLAEATKQPGLFHRYCLTDRNKILTSEGAFSISEIRNGRSVSDGFGGFTKVVSNVVFNYSGVIYILKSRDFEVSGTPDHSILTQYGFMPFEQIRVGDKVMKNNPNIFRGIINGGITDPQDFITKVFQDIFFSQISSDTVLVAMFPTVDLDNQVTNLKITYKNINNFLGDKTNPYICKPFGDPRFVLCGLSTQCISQALACFDSHISPVHIPSIVHKMLDSTTSWNTQLFHRIFDRCGAFETTEWGDFFSTHLFFVVDLNQEFTSIAMQFFNLFYGLAYHIENSEVLQTSCQVYDIEVEGGVYELDNGIISHNCRHSITPYIETSIEFDRYEPPTKTDIETEKKNLTKLLISNN